MTAEELLASLAHRGITVAARGGDLHLRAPRGALTTDLRAALRSHKPALVRLLAGHDRPRRGPLTGSQRQLWFMHQLEPTASAYTVTIVARIEGELDTHSLQRALSELVQRNASLRTHFEAGVPEPTQVELPAGEVPLPQRPLPAGTTLQQAVAGEADRSFDLAAGPLFRALLLQRGTRGWALVLTAHHIILDGLSCRLLLEELGQLYGSFAAGRPSRLEPSAHQLLDFALEQDRRTRTPEFAAQLDHWRTVLADHPPPLELPADHPRPGAPSFRGRRLGLALPEALPRELDALQRGTGATVFMILLAAFKVVLWRWTGATDIAVGTPVINRTSQAYERLVGMFTDTLVLRTELGQSLTFRQLLGRVEAATLAAFANPDVPLDRLAVELASVARGARTPGGSPLFQVMFNLVGLPPPSLELAGLQVEVEENMPGSRFDLTLYAYHHGGELELVAAYSTDLFHSARMKQLLHQLRDVLQQVVRDPDRPIGELRLATAGTTGWMSGPRRPLHTGGVQSSGERGSTSDAVFRAADRCPDATALCSATGQWSYARLVHEAGELVRRLRAAGAQPGSRVAVWGARGPRLVARLLGVWRAGAAFVVLDPRHPEQHNRRVLQQAAPQLVLELDGRLSPSGGRPRESRGPLPAHVTFTSGTTGIPRGVVGTHGPLLHFIRWYSRLLEVGPADRFALLAGLTHDPLMRDLFVPLTAGARLHIPEADPELLGGELLPWLRQQSITILHLTPPLGRLLVAAAGPVAGGGAGLLPALRSVLFGADVLQPRDVATWHRLAPNARLFNGYGTTETPQLVAFHELHPPRDSRAARVPVGRGAPGSQLLVQTRAGQPAGVGELGHVVVRSPHLALGYLDGSPLARDDPHQAGVPCYRTGDLGRYTPDGSVELAGRADRQLKIRGARVEPAAVEAALLAHPGVEAAVVSSPGRDAAVDMELVAHVVPSPGSALAGDDARATLLPWLRGRLPPSHLPSRYMVLEQLPLTPHGKVDLRALPEPGPHQGAAATPRSGLEHAVAAIWSAALGVAQVDPADDFFDLGGHSLLAAQVVSRVRESLGVALPLRSLFQAPTLSGLVEQIARMGRQQPLPPLEPAGDTRQVPASPAQRRMWLLDRLGEAGPPYRIHRAARLAGRLDREALDAALVELERRHASLRTTLDGVDGEPVLRVRPARETVLDCLAEPPDDVWEVDLAADPMWRVRLWPVGAGEQVLEIAVHHIAADGLSMGLLSRELSALYGAFAAGEPSPLAPLAVEYRDFAAWQQRCLASEQYRSQLAYWRQRLAGAEPLDLPARGPRPPVQTFRGGFCRRVVEQPLVLGLTALARDHGATPFMLLLTAFAAVLHRYTGQTDLTVGTPLGVRPHSATEGLVGLFLNPVALRFNAAGDPTLEQLLRRVRDTTLEAFTHADVPFEQVVRAVDPPRDRSRTPIFQVLLNMLDLGRDALELPGLEVTVLPPHEPPARYDLTLYAVTRGQGLELALVRNRELLERAQAEALLDHLLRTIEVLCNEPRTRLSAVVLPSPARGQQAHRAGDGVPRRPGFCAWDEAEVERSIGDRFALVARRFAEHPAVWCRHQRLDYGQLLERADAVAAAVDRAAPASGRVGLLLDKSAALAVGLLGTLRAGRAYVPLDPCWPDARLAEIAGDAAIAGMVTCGPLEQRLEALGPLPPSWFVINVDEVPPAGSWTPPRVDPGELAYILYTTGSTGRPKGVMQSHGNVLRHIRTYSHRVGIDRDDRVGLLSTYAFDAAVMDIHGALLNGATLVPVDLGTGDTLARLPQHLEELAITIYHSTPTLWRHLGELARGRRLSSVRCVVLGGEEALASDVELCRRLCEPGCWFVNGLGPTESTLALQYILGPGDSIGRAAVPAGYAVGGIQARLEGPAGEQPAIYGSGEIVLRGQQLALGYWQQPEQTRAAFSTDAAGVREYRTGDLGRWLPGGALEFAGRRDSQVKVRGFRVEPREVEAALLAHEGLARAVVLARDGQLVARVVPVTDAVTPRALRGWLGRRLPAFMMPHHFVVHDELPLTATGKVDRRALAALPLPEVAREPARAPRDETEAAVARLFGDLLGLERVGPRQDFFELGGHSLTAARLLDRLQLQLGGAPPLPHFFESPTVAAVTAWLAGEEHQRPAVARLFSMGAREPGGDERAPVFYCVAPPGERAALRYARLAQAVSASMPFVALEPAPPGLTDPITVSAMAAAGLQALTEFDPHGPYLLAGYSNGGIVALELAHQLMQARREVRLLVLLDSFPPLLAHPRRVRQEVAARRADPLQVVRQRARRLGILDQGRQTAALLAPHAERARQVRQAMDSYPPPDWPGQALLFLALETEPGAGAGTSPQQRREGWRQLATELAVIEVACDHWSLLEAPAVQRVAELLSQRVKKGGRSSPVYW